MRVDYQERFQQLVNDYNLGSMNQESFFKELIKFSKNLKGEERRKFVEGLTEEELALFDKLKKPELSIKETKQLKQVAKELLYKLKHDGLSAVDWRKKQQTRAAVRREIEIKLEEGLPESYTDNEYEQKCEVAFQHVFDNYFGERKSVYSENYDITKQVA